MAVETGQVPVSVEEKLESYRQFTEKQSANGYRAGKVVLEMLDAEYKKRLGMAESLSKTEKQVLIVDCSEGIDLGPLTMIADKRLTGANCRIADLNKGDKLPSSLEDICGIILTGSPADIREKESKPWIKEMEEFSMRALAEKIPVLGICFGMQSGADAKGRIIIPNRGEKNYGLTKVSVWLNSDQDRLQNHPIFRGLPFQKDAEGNRSLVFDATVNHSYGLEPERGKAENDRKILPGFEFTSDGNAYPGVLVDGDFIGLQFHPENMTRIGFYCTYTVVQTMGKEILDSQKSPREKLKKLQEWEKRLKELERFKKEENDALKKGKIFPSLRIFQNFVSMALEPGRDAGT